MQLAALASLLLFAPLADAAGIAGTDAAGNSAAGTIAEHSTQKPFMWYFEQCDTFGKAITVLLIICSIISICTMVTKFFELRSLNTRNHTFAWKFAKTNSILAFCETLRLDTALCPFECLVSEAGKALKKQQGRQLTEETIALWVDHVENAIQRGLAAQFVRYERRISLLSSFVSGAPFIGLLGTVYGVMIAFGGLTDKASISQLAPGVAGALVTTTCGLLVAIPATFGFNYLITRTRLMTAELENFASMLGDGVELELRNLYALNSTPPPAPATPPPAPAMSPHTMPTPLNLEP